MTTNWSTSAPQWISSIAYGNFYHVPFKLSVQVNCFAINVIQFSENCSSFNDLSQSLQYTLQRAKADHPMVRTFENNSTFLGFYHYYCYYTCGFPRCFSTIRQGSGKCSVRTMPRLNLKAWNLSIFWLKWALKSWKEITYTSSAVRFFPPWYLYVTCWRSGYNHGWFNSLQVIIW